jgi:hypothetical protein
MLRRRSATVRNSKSGVTSRRLDLAMIFALTESGLGVICDDYGQLSKRPLVMLRRQIAACRAAVALLGAPFRLPAPDRLPPRIFDFL